MRTLNAIKMTARQFLQLGEDPDGVRLELFDGEIIVSPSPSPDHSHTGLILTQIILNHIRPNKLGRLFGDTDTIFSSHEVRRPDLAFYRTERLHLVGENALQGPPDLCIEIISPTSATIDRVEKFQLYERHGVSNYWLVDPHAKTLEAYTLSDGKYQLVHMARDPQTVRLPPFESMDLHLGDLWPNP